MFTTSRKLALVAAIVMVTGVTTGTANAGTVWTWTGNNSNSFDDTGNWLEDGAPATSTPSAGNNQIDTPSDTSSIIIFDSTTWTQDPTTIYTRTGNDWGVIRVDNGTVTWKNDSNNQGNYSFSDADSGSPTMIVGDGDATTAAVADFNVTQWNEDGGDKTYVINSDGTLASGRGGDHDWSNGANDTVMRILGGAVNIDGAFDEADLISDANDYVSFEDYGSTFTFNKGAAGWFDDASDVTGGFGDAFRLGGSLNSGNAALDLTDGDTTWTISAGIPEPSSLALLGLGGLALMYRRRRR